MSSLHMCICMTLFAMQLRDMKWGVGVWRAFGVYMNNLMCAGEGVGIRRRM